MTIGVGYTWGSEVAERLADLIEDEEVEPQFVYKRVRLLFGFELITN